MLERRAEQIFERLFSNTASLTGLALTLSTAGLRFIHCQANPAKRRRAGICENEKINHNFLKEPINLLQS